MFYTGVEAKQHEHTGTKKMTSFEYCVNKVFESEGGLSEQVNDKGGITKWGIVQDDLTEVGYIGKVKDLSQDQAKQIFKELYWDSLLLDSVDDQDIALHIFDSAVLQGRPRTIKWVQKTLNTLDTGNITDIKIDGLMGMNTILKINNMLPINKIKFIDRLVAERKHAFNLACLMDFTQKIFINGWYARVNRLPWSKNT